MKSIIKFAVSNPVTICMLVLAILLLGKISYDQLAVDLLPDLNNPRLFIELKAGERPPEEIEKQFVTCGFAESLVLLAVFLQHIVGQGSYRLVGGVLKYRMVGMLGGQYLCQPLRGGQT